MNQTQLRLPPFSLAALVSSLLLTACWESDAPPPANMQSGVAAPQAGSAAAASGLPFLGAAGIGVADLDASFAFYSGVFGMKLRYELPVPGYVNERILYFEGSQGSDVVLMNYVDGMPHDYAMNPVKLVFYVPSASAAVEAIRGRGLPIVSEPVAQAAFGNTVIGFARDPDGYVLEIIESPQLKVPYLGAVGLGVSDLAKAKDFYERVLGMRAMGDLLKVPGVWDEWILQHASGRGSAIVLLTYTDGQPHDYTNNPIKTVHFVPDAQSLTAAVAKEGLQVLSPPMKFNVQGVDALIALARDPDGYVLELVTTP